MKQQRFKQRLAMLMMTGMVVSQAGAPAFAVTYNEGIFGYYGQQMIEKIDNVSASTTAAQIYASFYKAWLEGGTEDFYKVTLNTDTDFNTPEKQEEFKTELEKIVKQALQALMYDHPETYWMVGSNSYFRIITSTTADTATITIEVQKLDAVKGDTENLNAIKDAVQDAVTKISENLEAGASDYDKVVAINEYLVKQFVYNEAAAAGTDVKYNPAHTLLGAFVGTADVEKGKVVCEGYAKAFKAICDKMGIQSILVAGEGKTADGSGAHMWNYVKMGEKWYVADITWNDPIGGDPDDVSTEYLLIGKEDSHIPNDGVLSTTSGALKVKFTYPTLSETKYEYVAKSNNAKLKSLEYAVAGGAAVEVEDFAAAKTSYSVFLPEATKEDASISITAVPDDSNITVAPVNIKLENGVGKAQIEVTAEDGITKQTYTINFSIAKSNNALLSSLKYMIAGEEIAVSDFKAGIEQYNVELPYSTAKDAKIDFIATAAHSSAKVKSESVQLVDGSATAIITVTAADGKATKTYKINFTTAEDTRSKANDITGFVLAGKEGKIENNTINVEVPYGTVLSGITPTITYSDKATVAVKGGAVADFNKPVTYVVTAENGATKEYVVNVKVASSIIVKQGLNSVKVAKGKDATFTFEFMPTLDGAYTIVWNSATKKDEVTHVILEANKTTSSALTIQKVASADKGVVSVKVLRDDDATDFVESKAELGIKSSSSSSGSGSTTPSTNNNNNTSGGGGGGSTASSADKKVSEAWKDLSTTKQEEVKEKFTNNMPYVLPANGLTEELVKELLGSDFSDAQVKEIVADPSKLKDLGINYTADTVVLTPVEEVNFKDMNDSHWAYGNVEKLAKLGIVKGFEDSTFRPKEALAVADTFTFLNRVMLLNNDTYMNLSRETVEKYVTNKESWAFKDVATISSKLSEKTLKEISELGNKPLSRGLLAQVLFEATQGKLAQSADSINFVDTQNSAYQEAIDYCVRAGLLKGTSANKMQPEKVLTRAELMTVLVRLNDLMK